MAKSNAVEKKEEASKPQRSAADFIAAIQRAREEARAVQKAQAKVRTDFRKTQNTLRKSLDGMSQDDRFKQLGANYTGLVTESGTPEAFLEHTEKLLRELVVIEQL